MLEFFLEVFSEEIPAQMQAPAAAELQRQCLKALLFLSPVNSRCWFGPRRIALAATINDDDSVSKSGTAMARGPREGAPEAAVAGFLRKHEATHDQLVVENGYFVLRRKLAARAAREIILAELPKLLAGLAWPKSMRWGQSGDFTWVRPLRRITCLLDGEVVPIRLGPVTASDKSEGHRFMAPGTFIVKSAEDWQRKLLERQVIVSADKRRQIIVDGLAEQAAAKQLSLVEDNALLNEVSGLVEWPVPLIGGIDPRFMALPPEVRELSMKVNQRYFALRDQTGDPAAFFAFVANIEAEDDGKAIIAGNERVLRARLADAEHFWVQDLKRPLIDYLPKLKAVTFHARLGSQYERAERIAALSHEIADLLGADGYEAQEAKQAGRLAKADLVTEMVGEFPELQGIMGGYYAKRRYHGWNPSIVGPAIRTHYQPKGPSDEVPHGTAPCAVALADKLDSLTGFFGIDEQPTGSGDPYALRRAALGVIRIVDENKLRLKLGDVLPEAVLGYQNQGRLMSAEAVPQLISFFADRLRVYLRDQGKRYDVLAAIFAANAIDDINILLLVSNSLTNFLATKDGANLLTAYRRAANILRIENAKDGPYAGAPDPDLAESDEERGLMRMLSNVAAAVEGHLEQERFLDALSSLATLRAPVDAFFDKVTVNTDDPKLRKNRLKLLVKLRDLMHQIADFSKIEG